MKKTFKCSCKDHIIEISYEVKKWDNGEKVPELWIGIYEIHSPKTGRKYKKPKLLEDVLFLLTEPYAKEMESVMEFLEDITMAWALRRK